MPENGSDILDKIIELRHLLHQNAELSLHEDKTRQIIKDFIRENTPLIPVEEKGCIYAVYNPDGEKTVALRGDFDALPIEEKNDKPYCSLNKGISHRCGHDGHTAALCGAMLNIIEKGCKNRIIFIFQKGEETGAGGEVGANILKRLGVDRVYGWHNIPGFEKNTILIGDNTFCCGSRGIIIELEGKSAHAAYPETGISPVNAIRDILDYVNELNSSPSKGLLHCTVVGINCGGEDFGVAAYRARLMLTLRGENGDEYEAAVKGLEDKAYYYAHRDGLKCSVSYSDVFPSTENGKRAVNELTEVCKNIGLKYVKPKEPFRWSEDFGHYTQATEGCFFGIGCGEDYPSLHTDKYDFPDDIIKTAVMVMTELALAKFTEGQQ